MTRGDDDKNHHVPDGLRVYRYTVIYSAVAITTVLLLRLWDLINGPLPAPPPICPR